MKASRIFFPPLTMTALFIGLWQFLPTVDRAGYFNFADQRQIFGINNALDVISNLGFLVFSLYGIFLIKKNKVLPKEYLIFGFILVLSSSLIFFGSSYFHLLPNPDRLFWDRLPMSIAFSSICSLLVIDRFDKKIGIILGAILIPLAIFTVVGWHFEWLTLRPYIALQFGTMVFAVLLIFLYPKGLIPNSIVWAGFGFYAFAKVLEVFDIQIFNFTNMVSGHTLKHIFASFSIYKFMTFFKSKFL